MIKNLTQRQFEYNRWANLELMQVCAQLDDSQLEIEVEGIFGRIQPTVAHIVNGEGAYIRYLSGSAPWDDAFDVWSQPLATLVDLAKTTGQQLIELSQSVSPDFVRERPRPDLNGAYHINAWVVLNQAIYHGIEHRVQLKILLTQLGVEHPELDFWMYGEDTDGVSFVPD